MEDCASGDDVVVSGSSGRNAPPPAAEDRPPLSLVQLACLTSSFVGLSVVWNYEILFSTPYILQLGLPPRLVGVFWLGGPLAGMTVQPLVGAFCDDSESSWGRRRPTMAISAVLCGLAMFAMAFSTHVLQAALAFQALNIAANGVEASCRGLVMDVVPTSQQPGAWAAVSIALNIGSLAISLAGGLDLEKLLPGTLSQFQLITAFAVGSLFITVIMTCLTVGETPHEMEVEATKESAPSQEDEVEANTPLIGGLNRRRRTCMSLVGSTVSNALRSLVATPIPLVSLINKASFWGWGAASCISMFGTAWVQGFGSDPALGLRIASLASAAATVFSMAGNFILPAVATSFKIKLKSFWVLGNLTCVGLLAIGPAFVTGMHAAGGILAGTGLFWCTLIWVPFALLGELVSKSVSAEEVISGDEESREDRPALEYKAGESIGVLNFYQSLPQLLTIALSTVLLGSSGAEGAERSLGVALQMGAGMAGISAVYSAWIPENESID